MQEEKTTKGKDAAEKLAAEEYKSTETRNKLRLWKDRLMQSDQSYSKETEKMDKREKLYNGSHELKPISSGDINGKKSSYAKTNHVRNIIFENIESMVSSSIPQPKVTPRRKEDEHLADIIEHFIRNELDRMPFEQVNDMAERTAPLQGGVAYWAEWDNSKRSHKTVGALTISGVHPKQLAPQPAVYTDIEDMDWIILKVPSTKTAVERQYGKSVYLESESEPELRSTDTEMSDEAVTVYVGYERNDAGGINKYTWVNDVELEDYEDYQARRQPVCRHCRRVRPLPGQVIGVEPQLRENDILMQQPPMRQGSFGFNMGMQQPEPGMELPPEEQLMQGLQQAFSPEEAQPDPAAQMANQLADNFMAAQMGMAPQQPGILAGIEVAPGEEPKAQRYNGGPCPWCGSDDWDEEIQEFEQVMIPITTITGLQIPGMHPEIDEETGLSVMRPTLIPFYKPDVFPVVLQKNVSVYGQLLGNSDADVIEDQQNTVNRMEQKIINRLLAAGTRVTLPAKGGIRIDGEDYEKLYLENAADKQMIDVLDFSSNVKFELMYLNQVYEEARQILGITDSYQGRTDKTATSAVAKQFSAAQAAGRLESKRIMKDAAYARIFEIMFKFALAYADEPRTVSYKDNEGETQYEEFNRYDFLLQDENGDYYWNDDFLFSCDTSAPLASNREAMWQETRLNLQTGAFGDPTRTDTLIVFWKKMEDLHYPTAAETRSFLEERLQQEQQAAQAQHEQQMKMMEMRQKTAEAEYMRAQAQKARWMGEPMQQALEINQGRAATYNAQPEASGIDQAAEAAVIRQLMENPQGVTGIMP